MFFSEREDGFVDDLKAEGSFDALAVGVRDVKADVCVAAGKITYAIGAGLDMEILHWCTKTSR